MCAARSKQAQLKTAVQCTVRAMRLEQGGQLHTQGSTGITQIQSLRPIKSLTSSSNTEFFMVRDTLAK